MYYYLEYINKNGYPYQVKAHKKDIKRICNSVEKEQGEIVGLYYIKDLIYRYEYININYKTL